MRSSSLWRDSTLHNDIALPIAPLLRARGHEVTTTLKLGRAAALDHAQRSPAIELCWIFITHNRRDFVLLHDAWCLWSDIWRTTLPHPGIIIVPHELHWTIREIVRQLGMLFASNYPLANELYQWREKGG